MPPPQNIARPDKPVTQAVLRKHLLQTMKIMGLSQNELADLFDMRQPSLAGWLRSGIPISRIASVERLHELSTVLYRELRPERIPQIVRTPDDWLDGRSILDVLKHEGTSPIYGYLSRLFAYQG